MILPVLQESPRRRDRKQGHETRSSWQPVLVLAIPSPLRPGSSQYIQEHGPCQGKLYLTCALPDCLHSSQARHSRQGRLSLHNQDKASRESGTATPKGNQGQRNGRKPSSGPGLYDAPFFSTKRGALKVAHLGNANCKSKGHQKTGNELRCSGKACDIAEKGLTGAGGTLPVIPVTALEVGRHGLHTQPHQGLQVLMLLQNSSRNLKCSFYLT